MKNSHSVSYSLLFLMCNSFVYHQIELINCFVIGSKKNEKKEEIAHAIEDLTFSAYCYQ